MMLISTVGELKNFIKSLPDDTQVLAYQSDMEQHVYQPKMGVRLENMVSVERETYEVFFRHMMILAHYVCLSVNKNIL